MDAHEQYFDLLNSEATAGGDAAEVLLSVPASDRERLLEDHPEWVRIGTFHALLQAAREELNRNALNAEALVVFVLDHLADIPVPAGAPILFDRLAGTAWKDRGSVHYRRGENKLALAAAQRAIAIFSQRPALVVHRASALFLQAQVWNALGQTTAALSLFSQCQATFAEHGDARHWVQALEMRAFCLFDLGESHPEKPDYYMQARSIALEAEAEARRLADEGELARIHNTLAYCNLALYAYGDAQRYFGKAFAGFNALHMDAEVQRTILGLAELARGRGQRLEAIDMMHGVYRQFLDRGMPTAAAAVLVELTDTIVATQGDVAFARSECEKLVFSLGEYDLPGSVRAAVEYVQKCARRADSADILRSEIAHARAFFSAYAEQPETTSFEQAPA
jgi:tetratricopeptide (TPR) repeat protein